MPGPSSYDQYFPDDLFAVTPEEVFVDCGAFDGDTIRSFIKHRRDFRRIIAMEPDPVNFKRLQQSVSDLPRPLHERIVLHEVAVAAVKGNVHFQSDGTAGAKILGEGKVEVACGTLDDILADVNPSYVKLDVEGAERDALAGGRHILRHGSSLWAVCVYHRQNDLWQLPLLLRAGLPEKGHGFFLRKHGGEIFDTVLYAVPGNRLAAPYSSLLSNAGKCP